MADDKCVAAALVYSPFEHYVHLVVVLRREAPLLSRPERYLSVQYAPRRLRDDPLPTGKARARRRICGRREIQSGGDRVRVLSCREGELRGSQTVASGADMDVHTRSTSPHFLGEPPPT